MRDGIWKDMPVGSDFKRIARYADKEACPEGDVLDAKEFALLREAKKYFPQEKLLNLISNQEISLPLGDALALQSSLDAAGFRDSPYLADFAGFLRISDGESLPWRQKVEQSIAGVISLIESRNMAAVDQFCLVRAPYESQRLRRRLASLNGDSSFLGRLAKEHLSTAQKPKAFRRARIRADEAL